MALAANVGSMQVAAALLENPQVATTLEVYYGAYMALGSRDHGTAATRGRCLPFNDENGAIPLGWSLGRKTGDTAASPIIRAEVDLSGRVYKNVAVTGLAGTVADVGRLVYATDDDTFDLTRPTLGIPIGIVMDFVSATNADVLFFSFETLCAIAMAGAAQYMWHLGVVAEFSATGDLLKGIKCSHHGRIIDFYAICISAPADADLNATIFLEIDTVDVTGGVITAVTADTMGLLKQGTAITAGNVFHEGSVIDVETTVTAAGSVNDCFYNVYAEVLMEPGL